MLDCAQEPRGRTIFGSKILVHPIFLHGFHNDNPTGELGIVSTGWKRIPSSRHRHEFQTLPAPNVWAIARTLAAAFHANPSSTVKHFTPVSPFLYNRDSRTETLMGRARPARERIGLLTSKCLISRRFLPRMDIARFACVTPNASVWRIFRAILD
jgi:hypothetical protein